MYRIYLDGELFYDPRLPEYALTGIKCDLEVNKTGTLRFTIPATHPLIGSVQKMYSELTLYQDKDWLYSGRVLGSTPGASFPTILTLTATAPLNARASFPICWTASSATTNTMTSA